MIRYRKIGGIHWLSIGKYRISLCVTKPKPLRKLPIAKWDPPVVKPNEFRTWVHDEHNHFIF